MGALHRGIERRSCAAPVAGRGRQEFTGVIRKGWAGGRRRRRSKRAHLSSSGSVEG
jgi:hypothetical protein